MTDTALCVDCDRRAAETGTLLCSPDRVRLADALQELADGHARLDPTPSAGGSRGGRGAPGFGSRPPARVDVLTLTDRRAQAFDPDEPTRATGIVRVVGWWADQARETGIVSPRTGARTVEGEVAQLLEHLDEITACWWVQPMVAAIHGAAAHLHRALGEQQPTIPLGPCPQPVDGLLGPQCGGQVRARAYGEKARCTQCGTRWDGVARLRELGQQLGDAVMDAPGIARYLDVPVTTVRVWAHRDRWPRTRAGRRTLYSLDAARTSKDSRTVTQLDRLTS